MAYEKQNFKSGEILPADKLNHIEDSIVDLENLQAKIDDLNVTTDKAWSSRRIIDTLCPSIDETGNPVVFYPVAGYPLGVKAKWEPVQEGSGEPSPDNVRPIKGRDSVTVERCGENLLDVARIFPDKITYDAVTFTNNKDGTITVDGITTRTAYFDSANTFFLPAGNYTICATPNTRMSVLRESDRAVLAASLVGGFKAFTLAKNEVCDCFIACDGTFSNEVIRPCIVQGAVDTGWTQFHGDIYDLTLPYIIYGGTVDAVTGEGQETWQAKSFNGTENWALYDDGSSAKFFYTADYTVDSEPLDTICSHFRKAAFTLGTIIRVYTSVFTDLDAYKDYLTAQYAAGTPVQIAYKLETPTPFTATGAQPIPALPGVNTALTDADSVTVTGRAMPEKNRNQNLSTDILFKYPRTGKVYTVKIPKFTSNPTTVCEKLDDNTGLVCEASTDTIEGRDDYAEIPLFKWYNCNYKRDENGHAYPIAIEGFDDNYTTSGNIDVGVIQMTPFVKWDDSNDDYIILSITDNPTEGYRAWSTARVGGEVYPYVIHSKYISSLGTDGLLHSVPNAKPERNQSYNNMITNYAKKGSGYKGAGVERNTWQIIFTLIKYANKSSQNIFAGTTGYSFQYSASIQSAEKHTYFPVTNAQAANIIIGGYVSVGYAYKTSDTATSLDRGYDTVHSYADSVKVLKIEDLDDSNKAVYLDVKEGFDTIQHEYSDTLSAPITLTSIHWYSGITDSVMGHHDGSFVNNNNGKCPYRVQGVEYAVGGYTVASDTVIVFTDNNEKDVYVSTSNIAHSSDDATIKSNYKNVGHIPSGEWWIGDIGFDTDTNATWPTVRGSGNATGVGDYNYGSTGNNGAIREYLQGGNLWYGSRAGSSCLLCGDGLGYAGGHCLSAD